MKRLDEILSKSENAAISQALHPSVVPTPPDDPEPACLLCGDAGRVRVPRPIDDPRFGKTEPCECVLAEDQGDRQRRLQRLSNLGALSGTTFESLEESLPAAAIQRARLVASDGGWFLVTGPSGSGKTRLAAAIANERIAEGRPALFVVVPDLLDNLRASYDAIDDDLRFDRLFTQVRNAPFLVLDDLDAASPTDWAREKLFQLINGRYTDELDTAFTTTAPLTELEGRIATRLGDERIATRVTLSGTPDTTYRQAGGMTRESLTRLTFDTFDTNVPGLHADERESLVLAARVAASYAREPAGWLVLQGQNGSGKTHIAAAIANRALEAGNHVFFAVVPDFLDHLRRTYAPASTAIDDDLFEHVRNAGLLVLDDLGAQASSQWAAEKLYQVVNYRTVSRLPTVVTTDLGPAELQQNHPRLWARIANPQAGILVQILAPHYTLGDLAPRRGPTNRR